MMTMGNNSGRGANFAGIGLVLVGAALLGARLFNVNMSQYLWPFFVIGPGLVFLIAAYLGGPRVAGLAIPGSVVSAVGLLLLYQNTFDHFESWAYAWALVFPLSVGVGMTLMARMTANTKLAASGRGFIITGLLIFTLGAAFFELLLNISGSPVTRIAWPLLLIGAGLYLVLRRREAAQPVREMRPIQGLPRTQEREFDPIEGPRR